MAGARITMEEFGRLIDEELPLARQLDFRIEDLGAGQARVRMPFQSDHLRPGGTVNGPVMMALADFTMYAAVLSAVGRVPLAVTTSLNANFLRRPRPGDLVAEGSLLKLGKRLAVVEVHVHSAGEQDLVAHVTGTYSIPPSDGEAAAGAEG